MKKRLLSILPVFLLAGITALNAQPTPVIKEMSVDGKTRKAMIVAPESAKTEATPVVFIFHGRGGAMGATKDKFGINAKWGGDVITVIPQGMMMFTQPLGTGEGWPMPTLENPGRDMPFFEAIAELVGNEYKVDKSRIYAIGQGDGGSMVLGLCALKPGYFAAISVCNVPDSVPTYLKDIKSPVPAFLVASQPKATVKFEWQLPIRDHFLEIDKCDKEGKKEGEFKTVYTSANGNPVVTYYTKGDQIVFQTAAIGDIVSFFKAQQKK